MNIEIWTGQKSTNFDIKKAKKKRKNKTKA